MLQPWIACPKDPRTEGVKIPPVRGPCADFQYFMCIVLPPAGDFLSVAFLYKERVSDGILFANSSKKYEKMPPETDGFWTSFCVQELLPKFRRSRESAFFYSRCRYIGQLKGLTVLSWESVLPKYFLHLSRERQRVCC